MNFIELRINVLLIKTKMPNRDRMKESNYIRNPRRELKTGQIQFKPLEKRRMRRESENLKKRKSRGEKSMQKKNSCKCNKENRL